MQSFNTLNKWPFLNELKAHLKNTEEAELLWKNIAPENLALLSKAINIKNQILNIATPSNAVAAKIKLITPNLLNSLKNQGYEVTAIQVKVQVKSDQPSRAKKPKIISQNAGSNLQNLATKLHGTPLGEALSKLAKKSSSLK